MTFAVARQAIIIGCVMGGCQPDPPAHLARQAPIAATETYVHAGSRMGLPPAAGAFQRISLLRYDAAGADVSGGYRLVAPGAEIDATTYLYPAPSLTSLGSPSDVIDGAKAGLCKDAFSRARDEVMRAHPGAVLVREAPLSSRGGNPAYPGTMAVLDYDGVFRGGQRSLRSELRLACFVERSWRVKHRFTYPRTTGTQDQIKKCLSTVPTMPTSGG